MNSAQMIEEIKKHTEFFKDYTMDQWINNCSVGRYLLLSKTRKREVVFNRQIACVFGVIESNSLTETGRALNIDHATVIHGIRAVLNDITHGTLFNEYSSIFESNMNMYGEKSKIKICNALRGLERQIFKSK